MSNPSTSAIYAYAEELRRDMLDEFRVAQEDAYQYAEDETNGYMVNRRGYLKGKTGWDVFTGSGATFKAYASEELLEHVRQYPRPTRTRFERDWLAGRVG